MKNLSLILNGILFVAVGYLMVQHFKKPVASNADKKVETAAPIEDKVMNIVYVASDTLLDKYEYFKAQADKLEKREKDLDATLKARGKALEKEFMEAQAKVQKGTMTPKEVQVLEEALSAKQQKLMMDQEKMTKDLMESSGKMQEELSDKIKGLLKDLQVEFGYDYILSYGPGTGVMMVDSTHDITNLVLERLNAKPAEKAVK